MSGQELRPSRAVARFVISAAVLVAVVVAGATGLVLGTELVLGAPDRRDLPDLPTNFPDRSVQYLPDLTVSEVTSNLEHFGLSCEQLTVPGVPPEWPEQRECTVFFPPETGETKIAGSFRAMIEYEGESEVRSLTSSCHRRAESAANLCHDFFQQSVDIVLSGQPPDAQERARGWVEQYADDGAFTADGAEIATRAGEIGLTLSGGRYDDSDAIDGYDIWYELVLRRA